MLFRSTPILIKPENRMYAGAVHKNIKLIGNTFKKYKGYSISAKDTDGILLKDNNFSGKSIITKNCDYKQ